MAPIWRFVSALVIALRPSLAYKNVKGEELEQCSGVGMALTGFTRSGECIDHNDDQGSHHICIDMASNTGGNFCTVTGQPDWCSSENMDCHGAPILRNCEVKHWCVCQWAFASYIENAGGCDKIKGVVCEATNMEAYNSYKVHAPASPRIQNALACLESQCGLT